MAVLLLNADTTPLQVISNQDAFLKIWKGVAVGMCDKAIVIHSPTDEYEIPIVLRLKYYANVPRRRARWSRRGVMIRDNYTCGYCGKRRDEMTIDHVIPVSAGGKSTWSNTIAACGACNRRKADRTAHEAGIKLLWEPKTPRTKYLVANGNVPHEWRIYLEVL